MSRRSGEVPFRTRRMIMGSAIGLLTAVLAIYLLLIATIFVFQRRLIYFPAGEYGPPSAYGLPDAKALALKTSDGETIVTWYQAPRGGKPLFIYLHGNGGTLAIRGEWLRHLAADGSGFLAVDYRGYGGSTGSPSEAGLIRDGEAAYAEARALGYDPHQLVLIGESIGTGVAVALAAKRPVKALVLDSAFSSILGIAAHHYWMFPVKLLMRDPFLSIDRISKVAAPKLFLHATDDPIVPLKSAKALFDHAPPPKIFIEIPVQGHMMLGQLEVMARMKEWLETLAREK